MLFSAFEWVVKADSTSFGQAELYKLNVSFRSINDVLILSLSSFILRHKAR